MQNTYVRPMFFIAAALGAAVVMRRFRSDGTDKESHDAQRVRRRITIGCPPAEVYRAWGAIERLPRFMPAIASVHAEESRSHWVGVTPRGRPFEFTMHTVVAREGELVIWESDPDAAVDLRITARFVPAPADRGTELSVTVDYVSSTARAGLVAGALRRGLSGALRRFKQWLEAGEVATVEGQPTGHAAQAQRPELQRRVAAKKSKDVVEEASAESFPASDAPASGVIR